MDLKLIEDALILIEEGSMSAAAARRNVTQPAFSRRIRALETWLNVSLVQRLPNRVVLTQALLGREAEFRALRDAFGRLRAGTAPRQRAFVIATQHSLAISLFPEIYRKLKGLEVVDHIRLRTRNQDEVIAMFLHSEVDLVLSYQAAHTARPPFDETVAQGIWRRDTLVPVVGGPLRFTLSQQKHSAPGTAVLTYPDDSEFGRIINAQPNGNILTQPEFPVLETAFSASAVELVRLGAGIAWVPQSLVRDDLSSGEIVALSPDYGRHPLDVVLSARTDNEIGVEVLNALLART